MINRTMPCLLVTAVLAALWPAAARGNETDQFTVPVDQEFADLGDFFSRTTYDTLVKVRDQANARIDAAIRKAGGDVSRADLERYQSAQYIAEQVAHLYGLGFAESDHLEKLFHSDALAAAYPGKIIAYRPSPWIYSFSHLPIDPRNAFLIARASTIRVYNVYFGTDKIGHFHQLGYSYFKQAMRSGAATQEEAAQGGIRAHSKGVVSEGGLIGNFTAGVYSNGDLAANYVGMKFYFNLTQPVRLQGVVRPPLMVLDGEHWKLNKQITPGAPIFKPFVSDHFNEALNPCVYTSDMRGAIEKKVRKNTANILAFYTGPDGRPRPRSYFDAKVRDLWTYYGENYGHSSGEDNLVTIGAACFNDNKPVAAPAVASRPAATLPPVALQSVP